MAVRSDQPDVFLHVSTRTVNGKPEPFLPGTGLAVWEVVLLSRLFEGDMDALMEHFDRLPITRELVGEALAYAKAHPAGIDPVVELVENMTEEQLRKLLPGMTIITFDPNATDERHA